MKKQAARCKCKALCILCLVLLLPLATPLTTTSSLCELLEPSKELTVRLQRWIKKLNDNLLPSIVQYDFLTDTEAKNLTDCCFIDITAQQLINAFDHLRQYFRENATNYHVVNNITTWLTSIRNVYQCANETCRKTKPRIVTGCTRDLFAYSEAYVSHYGTIIDRCEKQHTNDSSFPRDLNTSLELNSCGVFPNGVAATDSFAAKVCSQYLPATSRPPPLTAPAAPRRTTTTNELGTAAEVTATLVNALKGDKIGGTKKTLIVDPAHRQDNVSQAASTHSGPTTEAQSMTSTAVYPSLTGSAPSAFTAKHESGDQGKTMDNNMPIFDVCIALFVGIILVSVCIFQIWKKVNQRMAHRVYHAPGLDPDNSNSSLDDLHYEL
ncbi:uncharacterized protein LOC116986995 isoform X2 [Amblyraja radiata]|uniref:uncharacterized protein LOC116986995 isoform X2 n=1 Tax=Amblyraja radiata TaxID=386614 RepID=UPI001403D514|nr:uncharacterized protein LOC116986995 isoform X2 [Amblyraja radiata]